jgi:hypothetical protein
MLFSRGATLLTVKRQHHESESRETPMKRIQLTFVIGFAALSGIVVAKPEFTEVFHKTYKIKSSSVVGKAQCAACHIGSTEKLNPYGKDLSKAIKKGKPLTPAALKKLEKLDSDKDKAKNLKEIKADTLPGDSKSKP